MSIDWLCEDFMRAEEAGKSMANSLIEFIHLMYQKGTAKRVLTALIKQLQDRFCDFT